MQCLPALGSDRFPWGTRWNRWNPTSEETPAPAALCAVALPDDAPACWGCTVSLQSPIYRNIFPSYHTVVTQNPRDCSHRAHRIASLSPTTYWALKPNRKKKQGNKLMSIWYYSRDRSRDILKLSTKGQSDVWKLLAWITKCIYVTGSKVDRLSWRNHNTGQSHCCKRILKITFQLMGYFIWLMLQQSLYKFAYRTTGQLQSTVNFVLVEKMFHWIKIFRF